MDTTRSNPLLKCTQCGGQLNPEEGQRFLVCPFCSTSVYIDPSKVVFHWYLKANLAEEATKSILLRWMSGKETAKNLEEQAHIFDVSFQYFPLWYFKTLRQGQEIIYLQPAAATATTELKHLSLPGGDFEPFNNSLTPEAHTPSVPLQTALDWVRRESPNLQFLEIALVHVPIYSFKYDYKDQVYTALVEASTGRVLANIYPPRKRLAYFLTALLVGSIFTCLSFFPLIGTLIYQEQGALYGTLACMSIGVIMVPVLIGLAMLVAAKQ
jgi:hypothetical protein